MDNGYKLNGLDLYDEYGYLIAPGCNGDFIKPRKAKDDPFNDWEERNGYEYDLSNRTFHDREAFLKGAVLATSSSEFWRKFYALKDVLEANGTNVVEITDLDHEYEVFYSETTRCEDLTQFKESNQIGLFFDVKLKVLGEKFKGAPVNSFYYGPVANFPTNWAEITQLQFQPESRGNLVDLNTGVDHSKFCLVKRRYKTLVKAIDLSELNNSIDGEYKLITAGIVSPEGEVYDVYGMSQFLPYSFDHVHQLYLVNNYAELGLHKYYFGSVSVVPSTWAEVLTLTSQNESQNNIVTINSGTVNTKFVVVKRAIKTITNEKDITDPDNDIYGEFKVVSTVVGANNEQYEICVADQAIPYQIPHILEVTIN